MPARSRCSCSRSSSAGGPGRSPRSAASAARSLGAVAGLAAVPWMLPGLVDVPASSAPARSCSSCSAASGSARRWGRGSGDRPRACSGPGCSGRPDRVARRGRRSGPGGPHPVARRRDPGDGRDPRARAAAQTSRAIRAIAVVLPPPTAIVLELGTALDESGLPDVFLGLDRLPADPGRPAGRPVRPAARRPGRRAPCSESRPRPAAPVRRGPGSWSRPATWSRTRTSSPVPGRSPWTAPPIGGRPCPSSSTPSSMSPSSRSPASPRPSLVFAAGEPSRGDIGATFGYPGGGGAVVEPAAVTDTYDAEGLDVAGTRRVTRRIVELRAVIDPGDSGGPLLLADGTVGGVVFAESRSDEARRATRSPRPPSRSRSCRRSAGPQPVATGRLHPLSRTIRR